jgi:hypothetical protein
MSKISTFTRTSLYLTAREIYWFFCTNYVTRKHVEEVFTTCKFRRVYKPIKYRKYDNLKWFSPAEEIKADIFNIKVG